MNKLEIKNISKSFGNKKVLDCLNLSVKDAEKVSILGPSGCGKSTVLNIISGIISDYTGSVFLNGINIDKKPMNERNIVVVSQENLLFPHMNVYENIAFSLVVRKKSEEYIKNKVGSLLEEINLSGYEKKKVNQLSGGEKQRVALARALASKPEVLLLDEAYSSLDSVLRKKMRNLTIELQKKHNITTLLVTHDKEEAMIFSDKIAIMLDGKIRFFDTVPNVYNNINDYNTLSFLFKDNFVEIDGKKIFFKSEDVQIVDIENKEYAKNTFESIKEIQDHIYIGVVEEKNYLGVNINYKIKVGSNIIIVDDYKYINQYDIGDSVAFRINNVKVLGDSI